MRVTDDLLLNAVDLAMLGTAKGRGYAGQIIRNLPKNSFPSNKYIERQLHRGYPTKLIEFEDTITFIMTLPGKVAMQLRLQFKDIIVSYLNGDRSVCADIKANRNLGKRSRVIQDL